MSEHENGLEDGLRRLFDDDRLAVPPASGAREAVVAGARRARRRRELAIAGSGVGVAAVAILGGVLIVMPPSNERTEVASAPDTSTLTVGSSIEPAPSSAPEKKSEVPSSDGTGSTVIEEPRGGKPPDPSASPSSTPSDPPPMPMRAGGPIGPSGWSELKLGMSFADAKATGYISPDAPAPAGCTSYSLTTGGDFVSAVLISESGLGRIVASGARTPEDQGVGSPIENLQEAYPDGAESEGEFRAETSAGATYEFAMGEDATAHGLALTNGGC